MNLRPRRAPSAVLDMTPLIDVVFLLLIFFMVSTTFDKQTQLKVDLPEAATQATEEKKVDKIEITIDAKGHFYINEQELVTHDLPTLVRAIGKISEGRDEPLPILVTGDRRAPYQALMTVMDAASQLNLTRVSFVAQQSTETEE